MRSHAWIQARGQTGVSQDGGTQSSIAANREQLLCCWETIHAHTYTVCVLQEESIWEHMRWCQRQISGNISLFVTVMEQWGSTDYSSLFQCRIWPHSISEVDHQVGLLTLHLNISSSTPQTWINILSAPCYEIVNAAKQLSVQCKNNSPLYLTLINQRLKNRWGATWNPFTPISSFFRAVNEL